MATPASNSVTGLVNPFSGADHPAGSCVDDPNFATICSFLQNFGEIVRIGHVPFDELQSWLENTVEVPTPLVQLHLTLLRRVFKAVPVEKWERNLAKFGHMYCSQDAWEIERFGYKKAKIQTKLNLLKNLMEAQFDYNVKFKAEVNKLQAGDLRLTPLGRDTEGQVYWYQCDPDANLRVYREDIDDETWEIVASTKEELVELISQLQRGEVRKPEPEENIIVPEEDSNSKDGIEPKEIILDTGKVEEDDSNDSSEDSEDSNEKPEVKKVEPLLLRNVFSMSKLQANQVTIVDNRALDKVKGEEEDSNGETKSESKPGIKLLFGMKSKPTLDTVQIPSPVQVHSSSKDNTDATKVSDEDPTPLIKSEDTVAISAESISKPPAIEIVPKSEPIQERTTEIISKNQQLESKEMVTVHELEDKQVISEIPKADLTSKVDKKKTEAAIKIESSDITKTEPMEISDIAPSEAVDPESLAISEVQVSSLKVGRGESKPQKESLDHSQKSEESIKPTEPMEIDTLPTLESEIKSINNSKQHEVPTSITHDLNTAVTVTETASVQPLIEENKQIAEVVEDPALKVSKISDLKTVVPSGTEKEMPLPNEPTVPESKTEDSTSAEEPAPVVEPVMEKKNAWICGEKETLPPVEEIATKESTWVCGASAKTESRPTKEDKQKLEKEIPPKNISDTVKPDEKQEKANESESKEIKDDESKPAESASVKNNKSSDRIEKESAEVLESKATRLGLVSALYSESSESSNDGDMDSRVTNEVSKPAPPENKDLEKAIPTESSNSKTPLDVSKTDKSSEEKAKELEQEDLMKPAYTKLSDKLEKCISDLNPSLNVVTSGKESQSESAEIVKSSHVNPSSPAKESQIEVPPNAMESIPSATTIEGERTSVSSKPAETKIVKEKSTEVEPEVVTGKRKAEEDIEASAKMPKLDDSSKCESVEKAPPAEITFNPIVGETIEEEVMTITGEGSGALNEGSNENSPVPLAAAEVPGSHDESIESEEEGSHDNFPIRGRGGRRGRGRRGRPPGTPGGTRSKPQGPSGSGSRGRGGSRGLREVAQLGVSLDSFEVNGDNERPVRASRRIAQIRLKEEEERRHLEEQRLAQLKAAQMKKKAKQDSDKTGKVKKPGKKDFQPDYAPEMDHSESEDNSEEENDDSDEFSGKGGKKKKKRRTKNGKPLKKGAKPWQTSSDEDDEEAVEEEEEYHYEEEEEELVFKSDHEFSPESDLGEDEDAHPSRHARTAKQDKGDLFEEGNCCKCGKGDHPEWILLCDKCDKGWHASCLRPQLWVIPEGEWFCPPCQHNMLIENLNKNLVDYEVLLKKRENEILRKQRLAFVEISMENVLPDEKVEPEREPKEKSHERRKPRRRILSDEEELSGGFITESSDGRSSRSNSSEEDSDAPLYRLRQRKTKKAFNLKEYDDMINSALREEDDEEAAYDEEEVVEAIDADGEEEENEEGEKVNGAKDEPAHVGGGKNDAYLQHLERQAQEEEETDEELLDEKERLRRKELKKGTSRKPRRRINDLEAYSEDEDSDDDFKASEAEDDEEEELGEDAESEWSGDNKDDDSDDSIAKKAKRRERHGRLGRREKYSDRGLVRRSTRKRKSRVSYDESDEEEDEEEDQNDKWQSEEETEMSESNSESEDETWRKKKKKPLAVPKSSFFSGGDTSASTKGKGKGGVKRKKKKTDDDDVDRAWNSSGRGKKNRDEPVERRTRGRKINFKDILDSGESDDEGNVRPKRRPLSDSEDSRSPSSSRKLAEEIRAENARREKEYEESQAKRDEGESKASTMPEGLSISKLAESSANGSNAAILQQLKAAPAPVGLPSLASASPVASPINVPPSSSPMSNIPISSPVIPPSFAGVIGIPPVSSPGHIPPPLTHSISSTLSAPSSSLPSALASILSQSVPSQPHLGMPKNLPFPMGGSPLGLHLGSPGIGAPPPVIPPVPVTSSPEKKSKSKGSKGSRSSKSEKQGPASMELEMGLPKQSKTSSPPPASTKSSKKRDKESPANITVSNPALLMAGGGVSLPDMLAQGMGLPPQIRAAAATAPPTNSSGKKSSSGKSSSRSSNPSQQTTPPPVSQNLSPSLPVDIDRVPNPALFQGNPGMRPFHPMWVRNPGPPGYGAAGGPMPASLGKPPPLNTSPFSGQQGPPPRPGFPSPPPLRIPNPNTSPLQAFQHFKRDGPLGGMYRMPPGQPPLANILPPGMMSPHAPGAERFFGPPSHYPYGFLPPGQHPQSLFPYDYRPPDVPFKDEHPPRTSSSSHAPPASSASSTPPPHPASSAAVPLPAKEEGPSARDSEFGGLVSYFSSQRSEEDMDT